MFVFIVATFFSFSSVFAETIVLKSGKTVEGKIIEKTNKYIKIESEGMALTYYADEIKSVDGVMHHVFLLDKMPADDVVEKVYLHSGKIIEGRIIKRTANDITIEVNGAPVTYHRSEVKGIGKAFHNTDGSGSSSYEGISYSPEEKKSLDKAFDNFNTTVKKRFREIYKSSGGLDQLYDKLEKCEPYTYKYKHPFTGEMMENQVVGQVNGKCLYTAQMPNGGKMECKYSDSLRKAIVKFGRDVQSAMTSGGDIETGTHGTKINRKEIKDPNQEALLSGDCVISGYGEKSNS